MIRSMTGFAAATRENERVTMTVTVRTVNHRHLDIQLRAPQSLAAAEGDLRSMISRFVARGRVELAVSMQLRQTPGLQVELNDAFVRALEVALDRARERSLIVGSLTPGDLLRMPQAITIREVAAESDEQFVQELLRTTRDTAEAALVDLGTMRATEGDHLRADLDARKALVASFVERIAVAADQGRAALEQRLTDRVAELRTVLQADETAVAQEIVRVASRSDISEEISRFRAHVAHWTVLADAAEPCGRKLDFLLQEMNREVNTMGSKADGLSVSEIIIAAKAELEKMREQVQNVE
ncbi:MAG: YicC/YloC family endoribonuclease [Vicinamibacterales bacterium]